MLVVPISFVSDHVVPIVIGIALLLGNHGVSLEVGLGADPIPIHFSLGEHQHLEGSLTPERRLLLSDLFDLPDLASMDDGIANGTYDRRGGAPRPLALFTAPRVDYSLHRLRHYTGTSPEHFQNFVLFTNYQFYIDEFVRLGHEMMAKPLGQGGLLDVAPAPDFADFTALPKLLAGLLQGTVGLGQDPAGQALTWTIASTSTATPSGRTGTPTAERAWRPASPNTRTNAPSMRR